MPKIVKEGRFNTGRLYAKNGQEIAFWYHDNGILFFKDTSRCISGYIPFVTADYVTPRAIMGAYDNGSYEHYNKDMRCEYSDEYRTTSEMDFGPALKI